MKSSHQNSDDAKLEREEAERMHELQMQLAKNIIESDEKNQFWKKIERIGNALSKKLNGWSRWRPF